MKHLENLGYLIPRTKDVNGKLTVKQGTKIKVKIKDLKNKSPALIRVKCDNCGKILYVKYCDYTKCVKENEKYYCNKCAMNLYGRIKEKQTKLKNTKSFEQWCLENNKHNTLDKWDYELNKCKPSEISFTSSGFNKKGYWFKCMDNINHNSEIKSIANFTSNNTNIECHQCNTVSILRPDLIKYFSNKEDAYKYSPGSSKKVKIICLNCKNLRDVSIHQLTSYSYNCKKCGDGISYPEKFMFNVLDQLDINFQSQLSKTTLKWCGKYKYDFYIKDLNCIIEVHGLQHYKNTTRWRTLAEEQENDKEKEELAKKNNIKNYIIIDCSKSDIDWIKNNIIKSRLSTLLNIKEGSINWLECHEYSCNSLVKVVCELWSKGNDLISIKNKLKINKATVRSYLRQGVKLNWCNYDPNEEMIKNYNKDRTGNNNPNYGKKHTEKTKQKIRLIREKYTKENHPYAKQVICLTTNKVFSYIKQASDYYNINYRNLCACCQGKRKSCGKHPETNEKLKWMYYKDYIKQKNI